MINPSKMAQMIFVQKSHMVIKHFLPGKTFKEEKQLVS